MRTTIYGMHLGYDDRGSGDALVLLHGFLLDRTIWRVQAAALASRCRVICVDLRGAGESGTAAGPALMETLAGDLCGLLDALGVERAIVAGHSLGGYVALAFFRMYAERVAGLGLIASHFGADSPAQRAGRDAAVVAIEAHGIGAAVASYAPALSALGQPDRERVSAIVARHLPAGATALLIGMKERVDSADLLEDLRVPVTIVAGDRDALLPSDALGASVAAIADCELVRIAAAGRLPMLEAPDATTEALERLVTRCAGDRSADPRSGRASPV